MSAPPYSPGACEAWSASGPSTCASRIRTAPLGRGPQTSHFPVVEQLLVLFDSLGYQGRRFVLREPVMANLRREQGMWACEEQQLHLLGYGSTVEEALESLFEEFVVVYDALAHETDVSLTPDAREVKGRLLHLVAREESLWSRV